MSWSASWRPTAGSTPPTSSAASRSSPRPDLLPRRDARGDGPRRRARAQAGLALVDEFAHTNVPGRATRSAGRTWRSCSRRHHVISTVNIQHLESLNDVVEITGVRSGRPFPTPCPRGRPGRARRHDAGGAAPPDGPRQHLPGREDRRRADPLLPGRQPVRAAGAGPALAGRQGRRGPAALPRGARHPRHLGGAGARGRRAHRRPGGGNADPAGRQDRRPLIRRRPAGRARDQPTA